VKLALRGLDDFGDVDKSEPRTNASGAMCFGLPPGGSFSLILLAYRQLRVYSCGQLENPDPCSGDKFMKCPYCFEEIKDDAVVCRFCDRDLLFFRPVWEKLGKLEKAIEDCQPRMADVRVEVTSASTLVPNSTAVKCAIAVAASVLLAFGFSWAGWNYETSPLDDRLLNFITDFVPFFAALGLGLSLPRLKALSYALLGAFTGIVVFVQMTLLDCLNRQGQLDAGWRTTFFIYVISGTMSFLAGGYIGEHIRGTSIRQPAKQPHAVAIWLARDPDAANQLTNFVKALAPILLAILNAMLLANGIKLP